MSAIHNTNGSPCGSVISTTLIIPSRTIIALVTNCLSGARNGTEGALESVAYVTSKYDEVRLVPVAHSWVLALTPIKPLLTGNNEEILKLVREALIDQHPHLKQVRDEATKEELKDIDPPDRFEAFYERQCSELEIPPIIKVNAIRLPEQYYLGA